MARDGLVDVRQAEPFAPIYVNKRDGRGRVPSHVDGQKQPDGRRKSGGAEMVPPRLKVLPPATASNDNEEATPPMPKSAPETPASDVRGSGRPSSRLSPISSNAVSNSRTAAKSCASSRPCCSPPPSRWTSCICVVPEAGDDVKSLLEELKGFRQPRRQSRQGRGQMGFPHRRGPLLPAGAPRRRGAAPVQGGLGDAGHRRLPPAGDARRDRGDARRFGLRRHARRR